MISEIRGVDEITDGVPVAPIEYEETPTQDDADWYDLNCGHLPTQQVLHIRWYPSRRRRSSASGLMWVYSNTSVELQTLCGPSDLRIFSLFFSLIYVFSLPLFLTVRIFVSFFAGSKVTLLRSTSTFLYVSQYLFRDRGHSWGSGNTTSAQVPNFLETIEVTSLGSNSSMCHTL